MWHPPKSDESGGLRSPFYTIPGEPGIKGAARPGCRAISPIRISIARPVAIWPCANNTFFAFLVRTMSSGATPWFICSGTDAMHDQQQEVHQAISHLGCTLEAESGKQRIARGVRMPP